LIALGADGSVSEYAVEPQSESAADAVEALIRPSREALGRIEARIRDRTGKRDEKPVFMFQVYRPRDEIPSEGVALFRADFTETGRCRVYVDGAASRPFLVEVFSEAGENLASNLDYVGVESVLEYVFEARMTYFVAVAQLSPNSEPGVSVQAIGSYRPRLVIAPK
jgi:hypothetical protein